MTRQWPWSHRAPDRAFDAYYYFLEPTGVEAIDEVLRALAWAGKMSHHTEGWGQADSVQVEDPEGEMPPCDLAAWIQRACQVAADEIESLKNDLDMTCETPVEKLAGVGSTPVADAASSFEAAGVAPARVGIASGPGDGEGGGS